MNESLFLFLNNFAGKSALLDAGIIFLAKYFIFILSFGALIFVFKNKENIFQKSLVIFGSVALAWLISQGINELYPIARPFIAFPDIVPLFTHGDYDSFPSGHATFTFALAAGIFYYNKSLGLIFMCGALLVGASRVVAGVHWPVDIVGGLLIGVIVASMVHFFFTCVKKNPVAAN